MSVLEGGNAPPARAHQGAAVGFVFDFASLPAFLAFEPTCALADDLGLTVDWLPLAVPSRPTPTAATEDTIAARHRRVRAEHMAMDNARYAAWRGLVVRRDGAGVDARLARAGCRWANRHGVGRAYLRRVWPAFWAGDLDLASDRAITDALAAEGAAGFDATAERSADDAPAEANLRARGVFAVPTYLVGEEMFVGRAHLPWIRAQLGGGAPAAGCQP